VAEHISLRLDGIVFVGCNLLFAAGSAGKVANSMFANWYSELRSTTDLSGSAVTLQAGSNLEFVDCSFINNVNSGVYQALSDFILCVDRALWIRWRDERAAGASLDEARSVPEQQRCRRRRHLRAALAVCAAVLHCPVQHCNRRRWHDCCT